MMKESDQAIVDKSRQIATHKNDDYCAGDYVETVRESEVAEHEEE